MRELGLFAGAGGGILGGHILGWRTVCAVECDPYAASVLVARQNDGFLPPFPIWDDVRTFDGHPWRGRVDVVSGGFPCQGVSAAGKGLGLADERSGLWREMARIVGEVRPRFVFVENSPMLVHRGLAVVLSDLAALGYDARWCVLGADDAGAPHIRKRIWIVAVSDCDGRASDNGRGVVPDGIGDRKGAVRGHVEQPGACGAGNVADAERQRQSSACHGILHGTPDENRQADFFGGGRQISNPNGERFQEQQPAIAENSQYAAAECGLWWKSEPSLDLLADGLAVGIHGADATIEGGVGRVATGVHARVDRLKCIGNGQVPAAAALAWNILTGGMK